MTKSQDHLYTIAEVASQRLIYFRSAKTVLKEIESGALTCINLETNPKKPNKYRIRQEDIDAYRKKRQLGSVKGKPEKKPAKKTVKKVAKKTPKKK